ncbi:cell wall hydrolase [Halanaerobacter jeridensis]|uniref:N-acetylmuramoyl-L-alanine amidase n=1 Tax=Halanaerobacter jeridensis TaxID=706427 RepID=A0A939BQ71_9FIRM|nr:cell wall hydrolase [Halanaerobacter jeridensis]MBM7555984.1 N-acetylmuramoyl-L-alanine amidase [Halanaerobacter jeridensis]
MRYKITNVIALTLIIMLITPSVSLLISADFSRTYAQGIDGEKAAQGLVISGLLVVILEKIIDNSKGEPNRYNNQSAQASKNVEKNDDNVYWLAKAIHAEARGEPFKGKIAVGAVILNRVNSSQFPDTVYGVIYQEGQFSSVKDGQIKLKPDQEAYKAAEKALAGEDPSQNAMYFYNPIIAKTMWWLTTREKTVQIGKHVFAK